MARLALMLTALNFRRVIGRGWPAAATLRIFIGLLLLAVLPLAVL